LDRISRLFLSSAGVGASGFRSWLGQPAGARFARPGTAVACGDHAAPAKLPGIGDEAWAAPMASYLAFSKGDVGVEIDMRMMPGESEKAIRLARLIASRL